MEQRVHENLVPFCFWESYDAHNFFSCVLTTEKEAAASKFLVFCYFKISKRIKNFNSLLQHWRYTAYSTFSLKHSAEFVEFLCLD